jgi:hypothetical protein
VIRIAVLAIIALASVAAAEPKPTIAIIVDAKDRDAIPTADALTASLRTLAGKKAERFQLKASAKDWIAAKRVAECNATQTACAVTIGAALGVDYIVTGVVETRAQHRVIVVNLINVSTKQRVRSLRDTVTSSFKLQKWAQRIYERVISNDTGEIVVVTNAKGGDVLIDGQLIAALYEGKATLPNLAVGTHALTIRAPGFKLLETEVTVDGSTRENILLEPL